MSLRGTYTRITDIQREILVKYYNDGMTSKSAAYQNQISNAAEETILSEEQVKKWIGNEKLRRARKKQDNSSSANSGCATSNVPKRKPAKFIKGRNSYNVFCSEAYKSDEYAGISLAEKNQKAAKQWHEMPPDKKHEYAQKATQSSEQLNESQMKRHKKQLMNEINSLEDMGCEAITIVMDPSGDISHFGSSGGESFLRSNMDMLISFREHFGCQLEKYDYQDVIKLFNEKYSQAVGKCCRVPYQKGGFIVKGLPDNLPFRKPSHYGHKQIQSIMANKDAIQFEMVTKSAPAIANEKVPLAESTGDDTTENDLHGVLAKVCGENVAKRALSSNGKICEEEVEVIDLSLAKNKHIDLINSQDYFEDDALKALKANFQHPSHIEKGIVLPVYTETEEEFWFFYTSNKSPSSLQNLDSSCKIFGYWLDRVDGQYQKIGMKTFIKANNIIISTLGRIYYIEELADATIFYPTQQFIKCILDSLARSGLLKHT